MIHYVSTDTTITLFWDMADGYTEGDIYDIQMDGAALAQTEKTHVTAKGLAPMSPHTFTVRLHGQLCHTVEAQTKPAPCVRIDITAAPYHACGDGVTLNTAAIQQAIDDCPAGGCVYIPAGDFLTGALRLHADMELYIDKGGILHGTACVADYTPKIKSRFEGIEMLCYASLLNIGELTHDGYTCQNVTLRGEGTICGGGRPLAEAVVTTERELLRDYMTSLGDKILECENLDTIPGRARPRLVNISCARHVHIEGVTLQNGASWNVHMIYSDDVTTHGCTFRSENVWNGDGWDPDSSTNCTLFDSHFYTGDDAVAIKSGKNPEGNILARPCRHIRVFDCVSHFGHGITIGSEMSGGIEDVRIWDCDLSQSLYGIEIKGTKKRGGYVRDVHVSHATVCRILLHSVGYNDDGEPAPTMPIFENCSFEHMTVTAIARHREDTRCDAIELSGFDDPAHYIKNITFRHIHIRENEQTHKQTIALSFCRGVTFSDISCGD